MMRYAALMDRGYGRISLDTVRSGSIAKQRERITAFAGTEMEWYADESVSGSKVPFGDRPDGKRLLDDLRTGDRVLVTKIDRAARSVRDLLDLVELIEQRGASIVFIDQNIDTAGPMGRFLLTLLGAIAELEAAIIAERRKESLESFAKEGRHAVGKAPWGFVSVENPNGRGLVIRVDPELRDTAREIVSRIVAGETQEKVRHEIGMSKTGMHSWLHNPRLAGMTPDGDGVVTIDGIPRVDPDAALLSITEWRELQDYLGKPEKTWARREGYGAALRCGVCRERLYVNISGRSNLKTGVSHDTYCCRREMHEPGQSAPAIMTHKADAYMAQRFLGEHGHRRAMLGGWSDSAKAKTEAIMLAEIRLEEAQRRFSVAVSDEQEDQALIHLRDAKRALRDAQGLQGERVFAVEDTGKTVAEVWESADTDERCRMLNQIGTWTLTLGRKPVEERIVLEPHDMLVELVTQEVGSEAETRDDRGGFLLP
jgi:DNA invertase Pin-like site-specific DNA recombinase